MAIEIGGFHKLGPVGLNRLADYICNDPTMVHIDGNVLEHSFTADHRAVAARNTETNLPVGFARLSYLFGQPEIDKLGIKELKIPTVYELGSVFVLPEYRGQGLSVKLIKELLFMHQDHLAQYDELLIGTTKNPRIIQCLDDFGFTFMHHLDLQYVAALTCTCTLPMGNGFQNDQNGSFSCPSRVNPNIESNWVDKLNNHCVMFTNSLPLAEQTDVDLGRFFSSPQNFALSLVKTHYYENTYVE